MEASSLNQVLKINKQHYSGEENKVLNARIAHVYSQAFIALTASFFCALIVFIGFSLESINKNLVIWSSFFISIMMIRMCLAFSYQYNPFMVNAQTWLKLHVFGAMVGGLSWSLSAILLLQKANDLERTLLILMLAGITAGSVAFSAAIPTAAILFLICAIVPYIISIALLNNELYLLFDLALTVYLFYSIMVVMRSYKLIYNAIVYKFTNDELLKSLSQAKNELELSNLKFQQAATHDPLTQVANRSLFQTNLEKAMKQAKKNNMLIALLYIDIDKFKVINDRYGHHVGDAVLITISDRIRDFFATDNMIARLGGDEFIVLLENISAIDEVKNVARSLCKLIALPMKVNNLELKISASIGISIYSEDTTTAEMLLRSADRSMYFVKKEGGNNFHFSEKLVV